MAESERKERRETRTLLSAMEKFFSRDKHSRSAGPRCGRGRNSKPEADLDERNLEKMKREERAELTITLTTKVEYMIVQYEYKEILKDIYISWKREKVVNNAYLSQI